MSVSPQGYQRSSVNRYESELWISFSSSFLMSSLWQNPDRLPSFPSTLWEQCSQVLVIVGRMLSRCAVAKLHCRLAAIILTSRVDTLDRRQRWVQEQKTCSNPHSDSEPENRPEEVPDNRVWETREEGYVDKCNKARVRTSMALESFKVRRCRIHLGGLAVELASDSMTSKHLGDIARIDNAHRELEDWMHSSQHDEYVGSRVEPSPTLTECILSLAETFPIRFPPSAWEIEMSSILDIEEDREIRSLSSSGDVVTERPRNRIGQSHAHRT